MIQQAVAQASAATGLKFVYDGLTTEPPSEHRAASRPGTATAGLPC